MPPDERQALLGILRETPRRLDETLRGLPRPLLVWTPAPGHWSILEVVCHLRDMERDAYLARYRRLLGRDGAPAAPGPVRLPNIDPDQAALEGDYRRQRLSEVVRDWRRLRRQSLDLLGSLDEAAWQAPGVHETDGPLDLQELVRRHARGNDEAHLRQIDLIRERHGILTRLAGLPGEVRRLVGGLPPALLRQRPEPQRWSMLENLCHLRDYEQLMLERYRRILSEEHPVLRPFDPDATAAARAYAGCDPAWELRELGRLRDLSLQLLGALGRRTWQRRGVHARRGEISIEQLVAHHLDHDATHRSRLQALRAGLAHAAAANSTA